MSTFVENLPQAGLEASLLCGYNCSVVSSLKIASLPEANLWQSAPAEGFVRLHEDNRLSVSKGAMLIAATKNLVLNIDNLNVFLQKGTVVLVDCDGLGVSIFCLVDHALNSVAITHTNGEETNMSMGQTCIIAKDTNSLTHLISSRQVALRRLQLNEQRNQAYATAEFSFIALAAKYECLKSLLNSPGKLERRLSAGIRKSVAATNQITLKNGRYELPQSKQFEKIAFY